MINGCGFAAVITAAGSSSRMGGLKKEYLPVGETWEGEELTVLGASVCAFALAGGFSVLAISVPNNPETGEYAARAAIPSLFFNNQKSFPKIIFAAGGASRRLSVFHALYALKVYAPEYVLIHDGARPWIDSELINRVAASTIQFGAALPVASLLETPKEIDGDGFVKTHLKRSSIVTAQTPQGFLFKEILRSHEEAEKANAQLSLDAQIEYTDDAEIWGAFCGPVKTVEGLKSNVKITFPQDAVFKQRIEAHKNG
ncbi:MAG: 2-C-methyl-D-erythritol 4-phosphate cytidylyltransferase [Spirochaetaceae bacterium]|nr:2-C-methyl-D-erythritol 4-phosphate cytidylyltransferase [Spirochaetaceae bacterium]